MSTESRPRPTIHSSSAGVCGEPIDFIIVHSDRIDIFVDDVEPLDLSLNARPLEPNVPLICNTDSVVALDMTFSAINEKVSETDIENEGICEYE